jgi:hypothetical protein
MALWQKRRLQHFHNVAGYGEQQQYSSGPCLCVLKFLQRDDFAALMVLMNLLIIHPVLSITRIAVLCLLDIFSLSYVSVDGKGPMPQMTSNFGGVMFIYLALFLHGPGVCRVAGNHLAIFDWVSAIGLE